MSARPRVLSSVASWSDWWHRPYGDPARVRRFQAEQLRKLTHQAAAVPYYAALLQEAGLKKQDIRDLDDLPLVTER